MRAYSTYSNGSKQKGLSACWDVERTCGSVSASTCFERRINAAHVSHGLTRLLTVVVVPITSHAQVTEYEAKA